jgi:hypothetical protein
MELNYFYSFSWSHTDIDTTVQKPLGRNYRDHKEPKLSDALSSSDGLSLDHHRETGIKSPITFCFS